MTADTGQAGTTVQEEAVMAVTGVDIQTEEDQKDEDLTEEGLKTDTIIEGETSVETDR